MKTETRVKKYRSPFSDGSMRTFCFEQPMSKFDLPHLGTSLKAVCLNGKWFFEAPTSLSKALQRDWDDAVTKVEQDLIPL